MRIRDIDWMKARQITPLLLVMVFLFGGVFGFLYEEVFYRIDLGYFVKRGTTFGPWIPIYGFGAMLIVVSTEKLKKSPFLVFLTAGAVSGIVEFLTGYILFHRLGIRLWDYNVEIWNWLNVGGYVCLRSVLFFGVSALFLKYVVQPVFCQLIDEDHQTAITWLKLLAMLFIIDVIGAFFKLM